MATTTSIVIDWSGTANGIGSLGTNVWRRTTPGNSCQAVTLSGSEADAAARMAVFVAAGYAIRNTAGPITTPATYTDTTVSGTRYCYVLGNLVHASPSMAFAETGATDAAPTVTVANVTVMEGMPVVLTAVGSDRDAANMPVAVSYAWRAITAGQVAACSAAGTAINIAGVSGVNSATLRFPTRDRHSDPSAYYFRVTVTGSGNVMRSACATVMVTRTNTPPTGTARANMDMATPGSMVTLIASGSDVDNTEAPVFGWSCDMDITPAPADAAVATFEIPADFLAEAMDLTAGARVITCTPMVTIDSVAVGLEDVVITVRAAGGGVREIDDAVLPGVINKIGGGINSSIYRRIEQRQKEEGFWK